MLTVAVKLVGEDVAGTLLVEQQMILIEVIEKRDNRYRDIKDKRDNRDDIDDGCVKE